ncbi:14074_t:CDS:1, partial [Cetraspora pellucida]
DEDSLMNILEDDKRTIVKGPLNTATKIISSAQIGYDSSNLSTPQEIITNDGFTTITRKKKKSDRATGVNANDNRVSSYKK